MEEQKYKVLTIWEPWASLVVDGIKKIETRPGPTSWTIEKGTYLIHAAKKWTKEQKLLCHETPFYEELEKIGSFFGTHSPRFQLGHIIGSVEVDRCLKIKWRDNRMAGLAINEDRGLIVEEPELSFGDYTPGRYAWILQNPRVLETPIPYKGGQGYYQNFKGDINKLKFE